MSVARKQAKAVQAEHLRSQYSPDPDKDLHSEVRESHSTSTCRYTAPV
jgi:hypothetical protein